MFTHIDHVAISVKDREKSIKFYEENFGFKKYYEHNVPNMPEIEKVVYLKLGSTVLEFEHWNTERKNSGYHFCIISDDFDDDYNRLIANGVKLLQVPHLPEPRVASEKSWQRTLFQGPDGETIEIRG